jgi:hypothetical protein
MGTDGIVHQEASCAGLPPGLCFDGHNTISGTPAPISPSGVKRRAAERDTPRGSETVPYADPGIVTNVQLFAMGDGGTGTFPLIFATGAEGTINISTRLAVGTDNNVLIGGFIITGNGSTRALIRAIGPSLTQSGVPNALQDPTLELQGTDLPVRLNDNWKDSQQVAIETIGYPPTNDLESAILALLSPGSYTATVSGKNNTTGIALMEVYDFNIAFPASPNARLANISTRGFVGTGANVMIGGFIIRQFPLSPPNRTVVIRAIGPSLAASGIHDPLQDPFLELHDRNGATLMSNDDWQSSQRAEIEATGLAPTDPLESAILATLGPEPYTAIVRGKDNATGVALVEVYALP